MKKVTDPMVQIKNSHGSLTTKEWMKTDQVANYLSTSQNNVRNMVYRGILFPKKFYGRLYFRKADIDFLIEAGGG